MTSMLEDDPLLAWKPDQEQELDGLLDHFQLRKLGAALAGLLPGSFRIESASGQTIIHSRDPGDAAARAAIGPEMEPMGYLVADAEPDMVRDLAQMCALLFESVASHQVAAKPCAPIPEADYEELQRRHDTLEQSHMRAKELSKRLGQRVAEQDKTIEDTQRRLYQADKLSAVGQLASGVAHEIVTPIAYIRSNLGTAQEYLGMLEPVLLGGEPPEGGDLEELTEDFRALLAESRDSAERIARIVSDLESFSHVDQAE